MPVSKKDTHKLFKQALLSRRYLSEDLAAILWQKCELACKKFNTDVPIQYSPGPDVKDYIEEVSATISHLSIEFKSRIDEATGKRMWAVVNTVDGEIAQIATEYTAAELAYFKAIIELIVLAPANVYSVSGIAAVREVSNLKVSMTKAQAETALQNFVANGWLYKSDRGRYGLSSRALLELELYLRRTFEGYIQECTHCTELCTLGVICDGDCNAIFHRHCYNNIRHAANPRCPSCEADWARGDPVSRFGEDSLPYGFDDFRRRRRRSEYEDDGDVAEGQVETPPGSPGVPSQPN